MNIIVKMTYTTVLTNAWPVTSINPRVTMTKDIYVCKYGAAPGCFFTMFFRFFVDIGNGEQFISMSMVYKLLIRHNAGDMTSLLVVFLTNARILITIPCQNGFTVQNIWLVNPPPRLEILRFKSKFWIAD